MAFWSSQRIEAEQKKHPLVDPFDAKRIRHGSYELALSREVLTTPDGSTANSSPPGDPALRIPPGQFALLYSEERVNVPKDAIAFISVKGTVKFKGLINISGFQVDPGFPGRLKFSVYNAGSTDVHLNYGEPCFLIWFADLDAPTRDTYDGIHKNQNGITAEDRDRMSRPNLSPAALARRVDELEEKRIDKLELRLNIFIGFTVAILLGILIPLFIGVAQPVVTRWFEGSTNNPPSSTSSSQTQTNSSFPPRSPGNP